MMVANGEASVPPSNPPGSGGPKTSDQQPKTDEQDPGFCSNVHVGAVKLQHVQLKIPRGTYQPLLQNRSHLKRFMESVLRLATKLQSLRKDLKDNYTPASADTPYAYDFWFLYHHHAILFNQAITTVNHSSTAQVFENVTGSHLQAGGPVRHSQRGVGQGWKSEVQCGARPSVIGPFDSTQSMLIF